MLETRCAICDKLLLKSTPNETNKEDKRIKIEIKCSRCKTLHTIIL